MQVVIDMDGTHTQTALARPCECMKQRERVGASAEGDNETSLGRKPGSEFADRLRSKPLCVVSNHGDTADPDQTVVPVLSDTRFRCLWMSSVPGFTVLRVP